MNTKLNLNLSPKDIEKACYELTRLNARVNYRENEYAPEYVFKKAIEHWNCKNSIQQIINEFFIGINLKPAVFKDTIPCLKMLKRECSIGALTNLPTGMPDEIFKKDIVDLTLFFDLYVSSVSCGYRKPNKFGLEYIAKHFETPVKELLFVGDEKLDIQTAQNAGCKSVLIDRKSTQKDYGQDYTIKSLFDLEAVL